MEEKKLIAIIRFHQHFITTLVYLKKRLYLYILFTIKLLVIHTLDNISIILT